MRAGSNQATGEQPANFLRLVNLTANLIANDALPRDIRHERIERQLLAGFICRDPPQRGDGHGATAAESAQDGALGFNRVTRGPVIERFEQKVRPVIIKPRFKAERTLTDGREHYIRLNPRGDAVSETE